MNTKHFLALVVLFFGLFSISFGQNPCDSVNSDITSKFRYLGNWDSKGVPDYLMKDNDEVTQALLSYVNEIAPEGEDLHKASPEYFSDEIQLNTIVTQSTDIYLTFVHEGAGWNNVLGFYTYPKGQAPQTLDEIDSLTFIFPNVNDNILKAGDKVHLGHFEAGTVIGYFLLAKGWTGKTACLNSNSHFVFTDKHLNTYTTPDFQQQTILLNYKQENVLLLGIEDIRRPEGDQDFNDAVFYLTSDPVGIDTTNIPEVATATISGDASICNGGSADIQVDLTGQAPWTIIYTNGSDSVRVEDISANSYNFSTENAGTYTLVDALDALGRGIISGSATVISNSPNAHLISGDTSICPGTMVDITVGLEHPVSEGSVLSLTYRLNTNEITLDGITSDQVSLEAPANTVLELIRVSNDQCTTELDDWVSVQAFELPSVSINSLECVNEDLAIIHIDVTGGQAPYTLSYSLNNTSFETVFSNTSLDLEITENSEFSFVSISDSHCEGITTDDVVIVDCLDYADVTSFMSNPSSCRDEALSLDLSTSELLTIESIVWSTEGNGTISDPNAVSTWYIPSAGETGTVAFSALVTISGNTFQVEGSVDIKDLPDAGFDYSPETVFTGDEVIFTASVQDHASYLWLVDGEELQGAQAGYVFMEAGIYEVTLVVNDGFCTAETTQEIEVLLKNAIFVPNVFNPNATHPESRIVKVYGNNILEEGFSFRIFNRWGHEVYSSNSFVNSNQNGWNGVDITNNKDQAQATFSYLLKGEFEDGTRINKTGTITLIR